jgi:hypothetical protein
MEPGTGAGSPRRLHLGGSVAEQGHHVPFVPPDDTGLVASDSYGSLPPGPSRLESEMTAGDDRTRPLT